MLMLLLALTILAELLLFLPQAWKFRLGFIFVLMVVLPASSGALFVLSPSGLTGFLLFLSAGRVFNLLRIAQGRMHQQYLLTATRRTSYIICGIQIIALGILLSGADGFAAARLLTVVAAVQFVAAFILLTVTLRNLHKTRCRSSVRHFSDKELPTVTVAIPARNETRDLEDCLRAVLANDYPKLEILVLDDCSADRTPEIIRQFAHDGVRFVKGHEPDDDWLAKNQACDRLASEANGELVLFLGVDVRLGQHAIRELVTMMLSRQKQMVSVLPLRTRTSASVFIQPMRYWWELALPRRLFNRPPVLSTCWIIANDKLEAVGGFAAARRMIIPEAYIARQMIRDDGYSFVRAGSQLDIRTEKSFSEQRDTVIRVRYPQLHKRPELMLGLVLLEALLLLGPFIVFPIALIQAYYVIALVSALACILLLATHLSIVQASNPANAGLALFTFPITVASDIILGLTSMVQYEFYTVEWKDRNICLPVMHVTRSLPKV